MMKNMQTQCVKLKVLVLYEKVLALSGNLAQELVCQMVSTREPYEK